MAKCAIDDAVHALSVSNIARDQLGEADWETCCLQSWIPHRTRELQLVPRRRAAWCALVGMGARWSA